jgi:hypothetical protein
MTSLSVRNNTARITVTSITGHPRCNIKLDAETTAVALTPLRESSGNENMPLRDDYMGSPNLLHFILCEKEEF